MEVVTPPLREQAASAPVRVPLRRRVLRRAAWITLDLAATGICLVIFLKALT
jgi:hypothetical protein